MRSVALQEAETSKCLGTASSASGRVASLHTLALHTVRCVHGCARASPLCHRGGAPRRPPPPYPVPLCPTHERAGGAWRKGRGRAKVGCGGFQTTAADLPPGRVPTHAKTAPAPKGTPVAKRWTPAITSHYCTSSRMRRGQINKDVHGGRRGAASGARRPDALTLRGASSGFAGE